ncbi:MAG: ABC transporter substrate-binding protein [Deltaproteobacteria bacterium]|nr:ABC transporter substrate-binding protein [Deltaproteobacteria bacterium]MBW2017125.1 ABC transporter substrate-binding protein [Deltaproteobacteria bacterium]MBW2130699.1 ABC transporter substrate-binding protein [Deltaproteobacteria bacterium]MBW2304118.1 ABC transporter substrate-binding protein [Deltaproteobacteria bacterium]
MKRLIYPALVTALVLVLTCFTGQAFASSSIIAAQDVPPRMMNPHGDDSDAGLQYMANFFDGLLQRKGAEGKLEPALAVKWERLDMLTWKFWLRKGVRFHNGNPFTAADVKFTFERLGNPDVSEFLNTGKSIKSIDIIDDYTVVIKTKQPIPWFVNNLHQIFIMDKESTETRDPGDVNIRPIGTGAYKLKEWVKGSYVRMEANEDYWEGAPPIKKVEVRPIKESSTRFAALVSGQVDIVTGIPVELFHKVKENPKLNIVSRPARRSIFLALGNKPGSPMADIRVRKAMYMAINEDEIIRKIMRGHATPAAQVPDPPTIGYNPSIKRLPYDPGKAKQLLKEAGFPNGFEVTLTGPNDRYVQDAKIAEAVARYLAKVGIKVRLDIKPKSIFFPQVAKGELEFYLIGWFDGSFDMGRTYSKIAHTRDEAKGYGGLNGAAYSDPDIDRLLESTFDMVDPAKRAKALQKLNKMAMVDKIVWIPLHYQVDLYAIQKGKGIKFHPRPDRWMVYKEISK